MINDKQNKKGASSNLTNWDKEPSYNDLYADYTAASEEQERVRANLTRYERDRAGGKKITARPGKSTVQPKLIRKHNEYQYAALEDPILSTTDMFEISPRTEEDGPAAQQNSILLNYQWSTQIDKVPLITEIVRNIVDEGTVIVKTGWEVEETMVPEMQERPIYATPQQSVMLLQEMLSDGRLTQPQAQAIMAEGKPLTIGTEMVKVKVAKLTKNQPKYEVRNLANIIIDPTCDGVLKNAKFIIDEYTTDFATLKEDEYIKDAETGAVAGTYRNLEMIKGKGNEHTYDEYITQASNNFKFADKAREKLRAYDYWGYWDVNGDDKLVPIIATWVNNVLIRLEENPLPHKRLPFSVATYMPVKKQIHGEPSAELLIDNQESIGKLTRAVHDITATQAVGQEYIDEALLSPTQKNQRDKGNTVYFHTGMDPRRSIFKTNVEPINNSVFQALNMFQEDSKALSGDREANAGPGASLGIQKLALSSSAKRDLSVLRRLGDMFIDMAKMTIAMNQAYMPEEQVVRVTNNFVPVRRDDIAGEFDLKVDISTPEKDEDTAQKLMTLLQTNAAKQDPELTQIFYDKLLRLWNMPAEAAKVLNFQPTPDPKAQQIQELEVIKLQKEIEEMDSRISERVSRSEENMAADIAFKQSKAEEALARAEWYREQSDNLAQEFVRKETGVAREEQELDEEFKAAMRLKEIEMKKEKSNGK